MPGDSRLLADSMLGRTTDALGSTRLDSVASLVLAIALRRARTQGNLKLIREALEIALAHDLFAGPAPIQAAAFSPAANT